MDTLTMVMSAKVIELNRTQDKEVEAVGREQDLLRIARSKLEGNPRQRSRYSNSYS